MTDLKGVISSVFQREFKEVHGRLYISIHHTIHKHIFQVILLDITPSNISV
jgi:hypothetical protein